MNLSFHITQPLITVLVFTVLGSWAFWAYRQSLPPLSAGRRGWLTVLRLAASMLLALILGGLTVEMVEREDLKPRLQVLVDASASMGRPAGDGGAAGTRYQEAGSILVQLRELWGDRLEIREFSFGLGGSRGDMPTLPEEPGTDIAAALASLPMGRGGDSVLLLSDGRETEGGLWAGLLQEGRPIHTVLLGDSLPPPDLRIESVDLMPVIHKGNSSPLTVEITSVGGAPRSGELVVEDDGEVLLRRQWSLPDSLERLRLEAPLTFERPGRHLLELSVAGGGGDLIPENNRRLVSVKVVEGELRILVLAGMPDWDLSLMMQGLRGEETLKPILVTSGPDGEPRAADGGDSWDPAGEQYHGLLVHSVHPAWPRDLMERLQIRGGVMLMGGALTSATPLAFPPDWQVPPIHPERIYRERQLEWGGDAARHPALQGAMAAGLDPRDLEVVESVFKNPLRSGRVLLQLSRTPVLVCRELGGRRLACLSARGIWRWSLHRGDGELFAAELISGLLRWLAREDPPDRLDLSWGEGQPLAGQPWQLTAEFFDEDFSPRSGADLHWDLRRGGDLLAAGNFESAEQNGRYLADLPPLPEGEYELTVSGGEPEGEELSRRVPLTVFPPDRELLNPAADPETLRWLAAVSGGHFMPVWEPRLLEERIDLSPTTTSRSSAIRLWQHPLLFILLLSLLATEWGLRKRFGMI